jgi:16S rRNA (guanine(966)-N(2))-methyltransferase RsmD
MFSMLGPSGANELRVLDIYAGTGALGIEALKRGAKSAVFIEQNSRRCDDIKKSLERQRLTNKARVQKGNALRSVGKLDEKFDLIFADPPYELNEFEALFTRADNAKLIADRATAFLEHSKKTRLPRCLPGFTLSTHRLYGDSALSVYIARISNIEAGSGTDA